MEQGPLWQEGDPLGPIGNEVLYENEHIRVWRVALPPKGHQPWHKHETPYLIVPISDGDCEMRFQDGRKRLITDIPGNVIWREDPGPVHELYNLEDRNFLTILVEVKGAQAAR